MSPPYLAHIHNPRGQDAVIVPLESGEMNDMILVNSTEIFRFPRTEESKQRLHYESRVLHKLHDSFIPAIPKLIHFDETVPFSVLSYIKGQVYSEQEVDQFSHEQKDILAKSLAQFMRELNEQLDVHELDEWTNELMPAQDSWDEYYRSVASKDTGNQYADLYREYYIKVTSSRDKNGSVPTIAIHGDLHAGNLLFNDNKLAGIIDFGDCETGTIYNELRPLYSLGHDIVEGVISELAGTLGNVTVGQVRDYAIMHELSVFARSSPEQLTSGTRVKIARGNLDKWLGEDWDDKQEIKAIIFDCFGVLTSEGWIPFRRKHFPAGDAKAFAQKMMGNLVTGRIKPSEFVSTIAKKSKVGEDEVVESLTGSAPDEELFAWIKSNKDRYKIGMLPNAGSDVLSTLFTDEQLQLFDDVVLSYKVGLAKPDPAAYKLAAERLGVAPENCLFVDDKSVFCRAARDVGMKSIQYRDFEEFFHEFNRV